MRKASVVEDDRSVAGAVVEGRGGSTGPGPRLWGIHTVVSLLLALVLLGALALSLDLRAVGAELARCDKVLALCGLLAHYATYPLRGLRWRRSLRHLRPRAGAGRFGLIVFFYNFVDNVVPAKLGDVYGAHLARINLGVSRSAALGSIVFLRMIDSWVVLLLAAPASWVVFSQNMPGGVQRALWIGGLLALIATGILLAFLVLHRVSSRRIPETLARRIAQFRSGMWPRRRELPTIAGLTVAIWGLEALWILFLAQAFGISPGLAELLFLTMIPIIASAFPLTPSGAGVVELTLFGCLRAVGIAAAPAASLTVLNRFIDYWLHIVLGILAWAARHRLGLKTWKEVELSELQPRQDSVAARATESS